MTKRKDGAEIVGHWTAHDIETAAAMWRTMLTEPAQRGESVRGKQKTVCNQIGKVLGRTGNAVHARFADCGPRFMVRTPSCGATDDKKLDRDTQIQRDALAHARERQSPLSAMLGDPPPGFSALDQRRQSSPVSEPAPQA